MSKTVKMKLKISRARQNVGYLNSVKTKHFEKSLSIPLTKQTWS